MTGFGIGNIKSGLRAGFRCFGRRTQQGYSRTAGVTARKASTELKQASDGHYGTRSSPGFMTWTVTPGTISPICLWNSSGVPVKSGTTLVL